MNKQQPIANYFLQGLSLTNRSLDIYLINLLLLTLKFPDLPSPFGIIFSILNFFLFFVGFGYGLSIPLFLQQKQEEDKLNLRNIYETTIKNTKRLIVPVILFLILTTIGVMALLFAFIIANSQGSNPSQVNAAVIQQQINEFINGWNPVMIALSLILGVISSFFTFTSIFFSIENNGFTKSLIKSLKLSLKHLNFIAFIILIDTLSFLIWKLFPIEVRWGIFGSGLIQYISLVVVASSLIYYKSLSNKE